jgi:hypothetical protein
MASADVKKSTIKWRGKVADMTEERGWQVEWWGLTTWGPGKSGMLVNSTAGIGGAVKFASAVA